MNKIVGITCILVLVAGLGHAEEASLERTLSRGIGLGANDLGDIAWDGGSLWVTGSGTLSNKMWGDGHKVTDWVSYSALPGFGGSITALHASGDTLMVAWSYSEERDGALVSSGDGFSLSFDGGASWNRVTIPELFPDRASYTYPGTYTMTYDIAASRGVLWCCTTSGFLLKSADRGQSWTNILPNTDEFVFRNPNHHGQCVTAYGDTVWVGTFQGINMSLDAGATWTNYSWPVDGSAPSSPGMPGNFCVAVEANVVNGATHVWVGSLDYYGIGHPGICMTTDNGATWRSMTSRYNAWNFAFGHDGASDTRVSDETVFAASDSGLVVSYDLGETWAVIPIRESDDIHWETGKQVFGVLVVGETLWVSSSDGLAASDDWGANWTIYRGVRRVETIDTGDTDIGISAFSDNVTTYAFPNPFSPARSHPDYARTRIYYALSRDADVTITVFDFSGHVIRTLVTDERRSGGRDYQDIWDGRDTDGRVAPNGVYYYVITTNKGDRARGKIMLLD